jgi:hypothetical protein
VAECPSAADGGFVECIRGMVWNKQRPGVEEIVHDRSVQQLASGVDHAPRHRRLNLVVVVSMAAQSPTDRPILYPTTELHENRKLTS